MPAGRSRCSTGPRWNGCAASAMPWSRRKAIACCRILPRQTHGELAPLPKAGARRRHTPLVQPHELAHQGEPDTEPRPGARIRLIGLPVKVEYVRQGLLRDTDPGVSHANDCVAV